MLYVIQILSAILIGLSVGAFLSNRNTLRLLSAVIASALAIVTIATGNYWALVAGTAVFLTIQLTQRDTYRRA